MTPFTLSLFIQIFLYKNDEGDIFFTVVVNRASLLRQLLWVQQDPSYSNFFVEIRDEGEEHIILYIYATLEHD
tara:strand:- start:223 stop:441 length:219 start_codon:yes stop_codon:yes gene_type:complete